jgi:photosystem II stability/assembly factor-like uncharacterized protein
MYNINPMCTGLAAVLLLAWLIVASISCSDDKPVGPTGTWSVDESIGDADLFDVWGSPDGRLFAVGNNGSVFQYHDGRWTGESLVAFALFWGVWGSSSHDVFVVGTAGRIYHYDGSAWSSMESTTSNDLMGIRGTGPNEVYAVGSVGTVLRYNGVQWTSLSFPSNTTLMDVFSITEYLHPGMNEPLTSLMTASLAGTYARYNDGSWEYIRNWSQLGIWASSWRCVWGVGNDGRLARYDGENWIAYESGTNRHLWDIEGTSPYNLFAVGEGGTILHFNGESWSGMNSGTTANLKGIWISRDGSGVAVGDDGTVLRYQP